tara:strand:+ start:7689 stop:8057 length:369 start_codon:yes stop_codon:yes gene_type:complete
MNIKEHTDLLENIYKKVSKTRTEGQKEYAQDEDNVFANFERIANLQGLKREQVLMTYLLKHIDGIMSYIKGHTSQREDITGRCLDAIVYITLLWGMIDESKSKDPIIIREETRGEWKSEPRR